MFAQIIRFQSRKWDELEKLDKEYEMKARAGGFGPLAHLVVRDREHPDRGTAIALFESYEKAMQNSNRPETTDWFRRFSSLIEGTPQFENTEVYSALDLQVGKKAA